MATEALSPLAEFSKVEFGGRTFLQSSLINVGVAAGRICTNNPARVGLLIYNVRSEPVAIDWVVPSSFGNAINIGALGGFFQLTVKEDGELVGYEVFALVGANSGVVKVVEVIRL